MDSSHYRNVFNAIERKVKQFGSSSTDPVSACRDLDKFKHFEGRQLSDDDYFQQMVLVTFYSGFRAATVTQKRETILGHYPGWKRVSEYSEADVQRISTDPNMICHKRKILACVKNAKVFSKVIETHGSFRNYIEGHSPSRSTEGIEVLKKTLRRSFGYLGPVTVYHYMTEIGLPVLKPDRVICRILSRLGFIGHDKDEAGAVQQGAKFVEATGHPIRYIDIVLVAFGQVESKEFGIARGICLDKPRCDSCSVTQYCNYFAANPARTTSAVNR